MLDCDVATLWKEATELTPGTSRAVPLSEAQVIILAFAVATAQHPDPDQLAAEWPARLMPGERLAVILTPHWAWAWEKLVRLGEGQHPLQDYGLHVQLTPPARPKGRVTA